MQIIQNIFIFIFKALLNFIYLFLKLFKTKKKVVFLSRQLDFPNLDFVLIQEELIKTDKNIQNIFLCKKLQAGIFNKIKYIFFTLKCMYHLATAKVCIIDSYIIPVSILKHKKSLTIIQIWHSLGAIKKFGHQTINKPSGAKENIAKMMNMHKNYTYVLASSKETAKQYQEAFNIEGSKIKILGMPKIDYILNGNKEIKKQLYKNYPKLKKKKNILYAPTFRKDKINNLENIYNHFDFNKYNLVIKYHPLDKTNKEETKNEKKPIFITEKDIKVCDLYNICDIVITDYSSVAIEASILEKQLYFYLYDIDEYKKDPGLNIDLFKEMKNCTSKNFDEIMQWIKKDKYNLKQVEKFKNKYIQVPLDKTCSKKIVELILKELAGDGK